jgi:chromosome segregation ATPase
VAALSEIDMMQKEIRDMQARLERVRLGLDSIEQEIDVLSTKSYQLERSVKYMKKDKVVALASEYAKVKVELDSIRERLSAMREEREMHRNAYARIDHEVRRLKNILFYTMRDHENNVLYGRFRGHSDR